ncbi:MAG: glycosyltransferase family 2 protein [Pirellula sp.]
MISVLIRTLNEEVNLPHCLASLRWCDDIVVLDSGSTDQTLHIAKQAGCRIVHRVFENESAQLNFCSREIDYKHPWVYLSDADEVVPEELKQELLRIAVLDSATDVAYRLRYKNFFMDRWIKHCGIYPVWVLRFFRPAYVRWERIVNCTPLVDGTIGNLQSHFHHYSFRKGLSAWVDKHNKYSTNEAIESLKSLKDRSIPWGDLFQLKDPAARRLALKELSFRMPCRSYLRFFYMYLFKLGFLDGIPGYHYCKLLSIYEYLITLKIEEIRSSSGAGSDR